MAITLEATLGKIKGLHGIKVLFQIGQYASLLGFYFHIDSLQVPYLIKVPFLFGKKLTFFGRKPII